MGEILNLIESVSEGFPSYFCKFRRQAFQDIVVPIQRTPRLLVGRDDLQTLRHSFNDVLSPAWRNKFQDLHIKFDKIPLNV